FPQAPPQALSQAALPQAPFPQAVSQAPLPQPPLALQQAPFPQPLPQPLPQPFPQRPQPRRRPQPPSQHGGFRQVNCRLSVYMFGPQGRTVVGGSPGGWLFGAHSQLCVPPSQRSARRPAWAKLPTLTTARTAATVLRDFIRVSFRWDFPVSRRPTVGS